MQIALFLILVFSFNMIQTIGACAGSILAMPFAIALLGADSARVVVNAVGFVSFTYPLLRCHRAVNWREVLKIGVCMAIGVLLAQLMIDWLYQPVILLLYSILVIGAALRNFLMKKAVHLPKLLDYPVLLAAGLIHGAFLSGGALLILYSMSHLRGKEEQRGTLSFIWMILNGYMLIQFIGQGAYTGANLRLVAIGLLPALAGVLLGDRLQKKLDGERFRLFTNCMVLIAGLFLLGNCLTRQLS